MGDENKLKIQLKNIWENDWNIPQDVDIYALSLEMMDNIGSTDPELRDMLILELLYNIISCEKISYNEIKELLKLSLNDNHLFYKIGENEDDSVFKRTFTLCIINMILNLNNECDDSFLSEKDILHVYNEVLRYFRNEKDVRGYVNIKGWAHSSAHTGDVLCSLSESKVIKHRELIEILQAIKEKICINTYTYINREDERLINAVVSILDRNILTDEEIINWINSFKNIEYIDKYPEDDHLRINRKMFMRSLYFRLKKINANKKLINAVEEPLNNIFS
ncbi:DUF2785 domain-containing protein [Clostridium frigidicarnis]|uniref:DUF2785 domain-containing protein n=1 Tax=Clostridium frigidicarnis TaxID=84698 RepID=A0A1I0V020_9CLOT|nr:DUF2785 domain-containing protein [Clostridium frigidicarnis]SFA69621.1 Protein of unknown function [Clostridium frigidicarnis]